MDFTVLYTHQKTKKSKKWQDGKLRVSNNGKVVLLNDSGNQLETVYVKADQIKVGEEIESDRHLITIEEETKSNSDNAQIVNQECNGSSVIADHHQRPLMRNPLRKRRMGFTVPRQLNQQQSSSDLSKENIPFNKPHIGYNSQHVDFESSAPLTTTATTYPSNISTPLHSSDIKSQVQPSCFTLVGKTNRNEHEARKVNHCQNTRVDITWNDDQGVVNNIDQPQGTVDGIHISNSYVQSNEERKHSDNEKSHRPAGKRSASQILALLGKKKQSFQPPLKKTKFETEGNGDSLLSGNVDVREPVTECRQSSVPRQRLDGAQIKQLLEVKDHQGEATIDGDHPPQDTSQDPYPDGQTNNSIYNSLDHSQSGRITYPGSSSSSSLWESSEPSQQQEYRNNPEDTWGTPNPRLDTSDVANKTSSHGKLLLQQNDRKEAVAIDRTMTSSISAEKRAGSFQRPLIRDLRQGKVHGLDGRDICAELFFPTLKDTSTASIPQRQLQIPTKFPDVISYKRVLTAVLKEHVNIILYGVAYNYFSALSKVDISSYSPCSNNGTIAAQNPPCQHKQPSKRVCVKKEGPNKGRFFFACSKARGSQCKYFQWADQNSQRSSKGSSSRPSKEVLSDSKSIEMYVKSFGVSLYCESQLIRKNPFSDHLAGAPAWIRKYRQSKLNSERKKLYLRISRKESSSVYGKDDLWVISKDLTFDPSNSFLAKSVFHGPNTASEVEIEPVSGYSPSNWPGEVTVHALHAYNASTELSCLHNIQEFVNPRILPVLPALLNRYTSDVNSSAMLPQKSFKSPAAASQSNRKLFCSNQQIREMAENVIGQYHLNEDQATALLSVARMFIDEETDGSPVSLIHGVFGAGKSYLLAVTVLFLYQLFHLHQENGGDPKDWKVLISSTTNVAVDRILLSLLQLGFEEFIRVGSIRKIAKPVLPYSVHASDKESQELKELQEMLKGDLSTKEKSFVRKSIERHRLGLNKKMLSKVLVVGVTCAACTFPCITNLKFPVVLLDECSQITEPACLLPVARFECQKLVLVGDPKQLDPTIQGSEPAHQFSLEQTMFDRLLLLGYEPTMLRTQYRCHPRISAIANELFYQRKLLDGVDQSQRKELAEGFPTLSFYNVAGGRECRTTGGSFLNDKEAVFLVTMLEMLMVSGVEPSQVGVITLYKAQVSHISTLLLQSRLVGLRDLKAIQISTVDAFQGGEKDIIILSCVRSDFMGFAASDKRTNVALTRSKHHLLIVGNQRILSANSLWSKVILKCRECKDGIQDSSSLMREWSAKLDEVMLEEKKTMKKSKRVLKRKDMDEIIQSEFTDSPPLSLDSEDDEEEHSIGESTPAVNRSQFKPTENSLQSEIAHPPAWTQNQLTASDRVITSSQTTSDLRVIKHGIAESVDVATGTPKIVTNSSSTNSDKGDSVRDVAEEQVRKVRPVTDGVFNGADPISVPSGDAITEPARLENSEAGQNLRDKTETDASLSNSPFSSENGKILVSLGTEEHLGSEATSANFEKSPSGEGTTTAIWTDDIGSPSYSPLKDVVESSDDDDDDNELPNFEFDTDFL